MAILHESVNTLTQVSLEQFLTFGAEKSAKDGRFLILNWIYNALKRCKHSPAMFRSREDQLFLEIYFLPIQAICTMN